MSWVQWQGETLAATDDEADLDVWLPAPDEGGAQQIWRLDLNHRIMGPEIPGVKQNTLSMFEVIIGDLGLRKAHWKDLAGLQIRSTAAWYDAVEELSPYGKPLDTFMEITDCIVGDKDADPPREWRMDTWVALDFTLSFGQRDGFCFPCELDAWAMPKEEFLRKEPESPEELARFAEGPPNLRVMTRAVFTGGQMDLERCGEDPEPLAAKRIRERIGCEEFVTLKPGWCVQIQPGDKPPRYRPGWRSTVPFRTPR